MVIYKITNLINGKIYVGKNKANDLNYYGSGSLIKHAIKVHGKENFKKEILETCQSESEFNEREKFWIEKLQANIRHIGYNVMPGGDGGDTFTNKSDQEKAITRQKLSIASKSISDDTKNKHRENTKALWTNQKYRNKVSTSLKQTAEKQEYKNKFSVKMKEVANRPTERLRRSENAKGSNNSKWLGYADLYDSENNFIRRYECLKYLRKDIAISSKNLSDLMTGKSEIVIGFAKRKKLDFENYIVRITNVKKC